MLIVLLVTSGQELQELGERVNGQSECGLHINFRMVIVGNRKERPTLSIIANTERETDRERVDK